MTGARKAKLERYFENITPAQHLANLMQHSSICTKDNLLAFLYNVGAPVLLDPEVQEFFKDSLAVRKIKILSKERFFEINREVGLPDTESEKLWEQFTYFLLDHPEMEKTLRREGKKLAEQIADKV
jgi:hypothetical protein